METFVGDIHMFGFNFAPRDWVTCAGQLLPISSNAALFSLLGTAYGGDGRSNFAIPDMRGRAPVGAGQGIGMHTYWQPGSKFGSETHTMTSQEMSSHTHAASLESSNGSNLMATADPADAAVPAAGSLLAQTVATGGAQDKPEYIYGTSDQNLVPLGGLHIAGTIEVSPTGGNIPFNILQPSLGINYCISTSGEYPQRT